MVSFACRVSVTVVLVIAASGCAEPKQTGARKPSPAAITQQPGVDDGTATGNQGDVTNLFQCPQYPIVLHHGFMAGKRVGMFVKVKDHFTQKGCKIYETEVAAVQTSEYRGRQLAEQLQQIAASSGAEKLNIIAHSQGGLDARYAVRMAGVSDKIASVSTLSTPHYGTQLADLSVQLSGPIAQQALGVMLDLMGRVINTNTPDPDTMAAANSMTTAFVTQQFNPANPDVPGIYYQSWAAATGATTGDITKGMLKLSAGILTAAAGANDGVVPVASAQWGQFRGILPADHLDLIGYKLFDASTTFNHLTFLEQLAQELASKGF